MLDLEGVSTGAAGVGEMAVVGDDDAVADTLRRFEDAGATEFIAVPFGPPDQVTRTLDLLGALARSSNGSVGSIGTPA
jgi:alkanesulfonate monooxygenase SsuD/methylene tetrahydromethanopterin reductase-like flavin-dependent oxidoreductase (luciferase family)